MVFIRVRFAVEPVSRTMKGNISRRGNKIIAENCSTKLILVKRQRVCAMQRSNDNRKRLIGALVRTDERASERDISRKNWEKKLYAPLAKTYVTVANAVDHHKKAGIK